MTSIHTVNNSNFNEPFDNEQQCYQKKKVTLIKQINKALIIHVPVVVETGVGVEVTEGADDDDGTELTLDGVVIAVVVVSIEQKYSIIRT